MSSRKNENTNLKDIATTSLDNNQISPYNV